MIQVYTNSTLGVDITPGKIYDLTPTRFNGDTPDIGYIFDDRGYKIVILLNDACAHLGGVDHWKIVGKD